jgi:hypothetical protein
MRVSLALLLKILLCLKKNEVGRATVPSTSNSKCDEVVGKLRRGDVQALPPLLAYLERDDVQSILWAANNFNA